MRKTLTTIAIILAASAAFAIDLYPTIDVSADLKTTAVVSVCYSTGYQELDGNGDPIDPAIVFDGSGNITSHAWTNNAAMLAWYKAKLNDELRKWRADTWVKITLESQPDFGVE